MQRFVCATQERFNESLRVAKGTFVLITLVTVVTEQEYHSPISR